MNRQSRFQSSHLFIRSVNSWKPLISISIIIYGVLLYLTMQYIHLNSLSYFHSIFTYNMLCIYLCNTLMWTAYHISNHRIQFSYRLIHSIMLCELLRLVLAILLCNTAVYIWQICIHLLFIIPERVIVSKKVTNCLLTILLFHLPVDFSNIDRYSWISFVWLLLL